MALVNAPPGSLYEIEMRWPLSPSWSCGCNCPGEAGLRREERNVKDLIDLYRRRQEGAIGYILLWAMGVPASLLFLVFLLRGCN